MKLDGGTGRDHPNGGDHDGDVWDDVPVVSVVAGGRAEAVGDAAADGEFRPLLPFLPLTLPFPMLVRARGTPPITPLRFPAAVPPQSSSSTRPPSPPPTPPFPARQHAPPFSPSPPNLSNSKGTCLGSWVRTPAHRSGGGAVLGSPDPFHFYFIYFVYFYEYYYTYSM